MNQELYISMQNEGAILYYAEAGLIRRKLFGFPPSLALPLVRKYPNIGINYLYRDNGPEDTASLEFEKGPYGWFMNIRLNDIIVLSMKINEDDMQLIKRIIDDKQNRLTRLKQQARDLEQEIFKEKLTEQLVRVALKCQAPNDELKEWQDNLVEMITDAAFN